MKRSPGAKRKLNTEQKKIIVEVFTNKTLDQVGFKCKKNWTIELIRQWVIKEFNVTMCHRGMAEVLYRLNLIYTRPTYVMAKADKNKQEKFKNDFEELKKCLNGLVYTILFQDESLIRDYQAIQKTWFIKEKQNKIPNYRKISGVKLIGTLDYISGAVYCEEHERYDAKVFLEFLKQLYPIIKVGK